MKKLKWTQGVLLFGLVLIAATAACSSGSAAPRSETPEVPLTVTDDLIRPSATQTPLEPTTTPLVPPKTDEDSSDNSLELSEVIYIHPQGLFSLPTPLDWRLEEESGYASFFAPDESGYIDVFVTPTGYELDVQAFNGFIAANEENYFLRSFVDYQVVDRSVDAYGAQIVDQIVEYGGVEYGVRSIYYQSADVIYELDFWAETSLSSEYGSTFQEIWDAMQVDVEAATANIAPYTVFVYNFVDGDELFSFNIPFSWLHERFNEPGVVVETFISPDRLANIQSIKITESREISKSEAGEIALDFLRGAYTSGLGDIKITDDVVQTDGSELLAWSSEAGGHSGISFFETRGSVFLMLTYFSGNDTYQLYLPTFEHLLESYIVP
jgi:hypothetical protein